MSIFGKIYRRNIYGIMGTLVFHILLFSAFLLADVDMKGQVAEQEIIIEFPDIPELMEELIEEPEPEDDPNEQIPNENQNLNNRTNVASNRLYEENATEDLDKFFDDEYLKELEEAQRLSSDVSNQLAKETVELEDIAMPEETTEGMSEDSIKNIIYVGESNIVYYLDNRYHLSIRNPLYLAHGGGKVIVDIIVDRQGKVISAEPRKNSSLRDKQIYIYAKSAAMGTIFNADASAPMAQKGTIHYTFIAQ